MINVQMAFIKGRSIFDRPLIVNEIVKWAKKSKEKLLIFKEDFEKAFDSLNWVFLDDVLDQMGFRLKWRDWVKWCITTAKVSVLVNMSPTKEFRMEKRVRQGDPLAPFLFILAAEVLHVAMREAQQKGIFKGVQLRNVSQEISIFQYADDALFLRKWSTRNATTLIRILKCFQMSFGLKVNLIKSRIMGVNVGAESVNNMARVLNCRGDSPIHVSRNTDRRQDV